MAQLAPSEPVQVGLSMSFFNIRFQQNAVERRSNIKDSHTNRIYDVGETGTGTDAECGSSRQAQPGDRH